MKKEEVPYVLMALECKIKELSGLPEPLASQTMEPFMKIYEGIQKDMEKEQSKQQSIK